MGFLQRLKHDLKAGIATLRHGTAQAAIRALEETELLRIRLEIRKLDQKLDELYRDVGERAVSLGERDEPVERVLYDAEVSRLVKEIQEYKDARAKLESEVTDIRSEI
jgi:chromosome segregation ATPase